MGNTSTRRPRARSPLWLTVFASNPNTPRGVMHSRRKAPRPCAQHRLHKLLTLFALSCAMAVRRLRHPFRSSVKSGRTLRRTSAVACRSTLQCEFTAEPRAADTQPAPDCECEGIRSEDRESADQWAALGSRLRTAMLPGLRRRWYAIVCGAAGIDRCEIEPASASLAT